MSDERKINNLRLSNEESNRFTCDCLKTALFRLIAQKNFESISVSELIREAGVSRNSFYRNFGTMDALLNSLREKLLSDVSELINQRNAFESRSDWYSNLFSVVKEKQKEFHILLEIKVPLNFFAEEIDYRKLLPDNISENNYEDLAAAGSILIILYHWFTSGMKESPEEMSRICVNIISEKKS